MERTWSRYVCTDVCLEFYAVAARLEHMPELVRVGQRWRKGPREQPKSDLMGKRALVVGRRGRARVKGPSGRFQRLATLRVSPGDLGYTRSGQVYRGGGPEAIRIKLFSKPPRRRAPTGARPLDQSYRSLAPCGFSLAGQHSSSHRD
jgi:hypothetical protein